MSQFSDHDITEAMIVYGGGFVAGLGRLYRTADAENREKLRAAFLEYWQEYDEVAGLVRKRKLAQARGEVDA